MRVLVLEDEEALRESYVKQLRADNLAVDGVATMEEAKRAMIDAPYDCVVMDRMVPDGDALSLLPWIRRDPRLGAVLVLSGAATRPQDRVQAIEGGADDFALKPLWGRELSHRVERLLLTVGDRALPARSFYIGRVWFDRARREVLLGDEEVALTPTGYRVFEYLAVCRHRMVPAIELMEHCWDEALDLTMDPLHTQITRLRGVLRGWLDITLVRSEGYRFDVVPAGFGDGGEAGCGCACECGAPVGETAP